MYYYIVTELCTGGQLFDKIIELQNFTEKMAAHFLKQILSAMLYCHNMGIMHRDLKPENILLKSEKDDKLIKVIDFGTSVNFQTKMLTKQAGTAFYIAPEVINRKYNNKADMWSIGVILYIMMCGKPPFEGNNEDEIFHNTLSGKIDFSCSEWTMVSSSCKDLIVNLLCPKPDLRYSASQALEHRWIMENTKESITNNPGSKLSLNTLKKFNVIELIRITINSSKQ